MDKTIKSLTFLPPPRSLYKTEQ